MNVKVILDKLNDEMQIRNFTKDTKKNYFYNVSKFLDWCVKYDKKISNESIKKYLIEISSKYDVNTFLSKKAGIKFLITGVLKRDSDNYPTFEIKQKRKKLLPKVLSKDEITTVFSNIKNEKHKLMIEVLYSSGLRLSELINLKRSDLNLNNKTILISLGKGKKDRITIMSYKVKEKLLIYLTKNDFSTKYLFESNRKSKYTKKQFKRF